METLRWNPICSNHWLQDSGLLLLGTLVNNMNQVVEYSTRQFYKGAFVITAFNHVTAYGHLAETKWMINESPKENALYVFIEHIL